MRVKHGLSEITGENFKREIPYAPRPYIAYLPKGEERRGQAIPPGDGDGSRSAEANMAATRHVVVQNCRHVVLRHLKLF